MDEATRLKMISDIIGPMKRYADELIKTDGYLSGGLRANLIYDINKLIDLALSDCKKCGGTGMQYGVDGEYPCNFCPPKPKSSEIENSFYELIVDGMAEAEKAIKKFPQPNYVITKFAEESGEVVKAAVHCAEGRETMDEVKKEMRQAIAMMFRLWVEGDQVHGLPPVGGVPKRMEFDMPPEIILPEIGR